MFNNIQEFEQQPGGARQLIVCDKASGERVTKLGDTPQDLVDIVKSHYPEYTELVVPEECIHHSILLRIAQLGRVSISCWQQDGKIRRLYRTDLHYDKLMRMPDSEFLAAVLTFVNSISLGAIVREPQYRLQVGGDLGLLAALMKKRADATRRQCECGAAIPKLRKRQRKRVQQEIVRMRERALANLTVDDLEVSSLRRLYNSPLGSLEAAAGAVLKTQGSRYDGWVHGAANWLLKIVENPDTLVRRAPIWRPTPHGVPPRPEVCVSMLHAPFSVNRRAVDIHKLVENPLCVLDAELPPQRTSRGAVKRRVVEKAEESLVLLPLGADDCDIDYLMIRHAMGEKKGGQKMFQKMYAAVDPDLLFLAVWYRLRYPLGQAAPADPAVLKLVEEHLRRRFARPCDLEFSMRATGKPCFVTRKWCVLWHVLYTTTGKFHRMLQFAPHIHVLSAFLRDIYGLSAPIGSNRTEDSATAQHIATRPLRVSDDTMFYDQTSFEDVKQKVTVSKKLAELATVHGLDFVRAYFALRHKYIECATDSGDVVAIPLRELSPFSSNSLPRLFAPLTAYAPAHVIRREAQLLMAQPPEQLSEVALIKDTELVGRAYGLPAVVHPRTLRPLTFDKQWPHDLNGLSLHARLCDYVRKHGRCPTRSQLILYVCDKERRIRLPVNIVDLVDAIIADFAAKSASMSPERIRNILIASESRKLRKLLENDGAFEQLAQAVRLDQFSSYSYTEKCALKNYFL